MNCTAPLHCDTKQAYEFRYDGHRNDILRQATHHQAGGTDSFNRGQAPEDEVNLFPYFSSTCFNGYKDGPAVSLALLGIPFNTQKHVFGMEVNTDPCKTDCWKAKLDISRIMPSDQSNIACMQGFYGVYEDLFSRLHQQEMDSNESVDQAEAPPKLGEITILLLSADQLITHLPGTVMH